MYNISSSCEVLWFSREGGVESLFSKTEKAQVAPSGIAGVAETLVGAGAVWLSVKGGNIGEPNTSGSNYIDPNESGSDVIGCSWSKDIQSPAGVFNLQVKPRIPYDRLIRPGDLFVIFMDNDHRFGASHRADGTLITIGLVDRVGLSTSVDAQGATIKVVSISGRDLGAIFQETQTLFDPAFAQVDQELYRGKFLTQITERMVGALSPVEVVYTILDLIYNQNATGSELVGAQWTLPGRGEDGRPVSLLSLINVTSFVQAPMYGYAFAGGLGVTEAGNVWSLIEGFANLLVNEFFFDVRDFRKDEINFLRYQEDAAIGAHITDDDVKRQRALRDEMRTSGVWNQSTLESNVGSPSGTPPPVMALIHRQTPYDRDAFNHLPFNNLNYDEIFDTDLSYSAHDIVNFFQVNFPDLPVIQQELTFGVLINEASIRQYGLRRCSPQSRFPFVTSTVGDNFVEGKTIKGVFEDAFRYYTELQATWYAANDKLRAGSISCRFRPDIRVGTRLRVIQEDKSVLAFYVQGVNQVFGVSPGASRTQLTVVRGVVEGRPGLVNNLVFKNGRMSIPEGMISFRYTSAIKGTEVKQLTYPGLLLEVER